MMEALAQFHFLRPWWLLLLLPALGLWQLRSARPIAPRAGVR